MCEFVCANTYTYSVFSADLAIIAAERFILAVRMFLKSAAYSQTAVLYETCRILPNGVVV